MLIVDDNRDAAASLARLVELLGHDVSVACDGHTALDKARDGNPGIVSCNVGMPGWLEYELAQRLRAAGLGGKLVAVTGYAGEDDIARAAQSGFDAHIAKPAAPEQVLMALA